LIYKDLFFSVFNIRIIENIEKAKYSTKNNISEGTLFFLATKNQMRAKIISRSILTLIATSRYMTLSDGSFFCPRKKI
jgi:endo-beta-N-acetylglucosaminidase D